MDIIKTTYIEQTKNRVRKSKKPIIVLAQNDNFNRKMLEYGKFDILLSIEAGNRKNTIRQIDSGLNHVLAKIAVKNNISIGLDLNEIQKLPKTGKAKRLSRIAQNIKICRKVKTKLAVINTTNKIDVFHFLISLGASTKQAKEATQSF